MLDVGNRRKRAAEKRALAGQVRRIAPTLSLAEHRELFLRHADDLEEEAASLERLTDES